ncbi:hypothetical protein M9Y10_025287 [Tritrichomonas musculus]|uniref:Uncharacterized protein n=1 Tax=Tritrichomonas musculus TaxID=1915356 RepID=A0ABR2GLT2_9EUKA
MELWLPKLNENFAAYYRNEAIPESEYFYNFELMNKDETDYLSFTDRMHLSKRMRYEIANIQNLFLVRNLNGYMQTASFLVLEFRQIIDPIVPSFIFNSSIQSKMDDDYLNALFGGKVCGYLLNAAFHHQDCRIRKISTKWFFFCVIGCSLDLILNGNDEILEKYYFKVLLLGFFSMIHIQKNTCHKTNHPRLFTPSVVREYLNLYICFFENLVPIKFGNF